MMKACNRRTGGYTSVPPHYAMWKHALHWLKLTGEGWEGEKPPAVSLCEMTLSDIYKKSQMSNNENYYLTEAICDHTVHNFLI